MELTKCAIKLQRKIVTVYCITDWMTLIFTLARSQRGKQDKPSYEVEGMEFDNVLIIQLIKNKIIDENGQKVN